MFKTTIRGLLAHKIRLLTTTFAVVLGVAFMSGTLVLSDTISRTFDSLMADANAGTDALVRSSSVVDGQFESQRGLVDQSLLVQVSEVDGVKAAEGSVEGFAQMVGSDGEPIGNPGNGAPTFGFNWSEVAELNPFTLPEGSSPPNGPDEVVVDKASFDMGKLSIGGTVTVLTAAGSREMTVVGVARFGDADNLAGASVALFTTATAQELVGQPGKFSSVAVVGDDGISQADLVTNIEAALATGGNTTVEVLTGEEYTKEAQTDIQQGLSFFSTFLLVFAGVSLFVGMFIIANTFTIIVAQRTHELALLRAIGAGRSQVLGSVMLEALAVGVVASVVGLVAGIGMAGALQALLGALGFDIPAAGSVLKARTVIVAFVVGVGVTLLSAILPALRASRVPPIAALRGVAQDTTAASRVRLAFGVIVTAAGGALLALGLFGAGDGRVPAVGFGAAVTMVGVALLGPLIAKPVSSLLGYPLQQAFGVTGKLARQNATRNPRRTSSTAAALMIGVSLVVTVSMLASSVQAGVDRLVADSFAGDLVLATEGFGPGFSPALADDVAALPEIGEAAQVRIGPAEVNDAGGYITAIDADTFGTIFDLEVVDGSLDDLGGSTVALSVDMADSQNVAVGDTVRATFAETGDQQLTVVATFENDDLLGSSIVDLTTWEENVATQLDFAVYLTLADGVSLEQGRSAVEAAAAAYPAVQVQDKAQFADAQTSGIDQMLSLIYALLGLAVIIALLGIANTLALSVFERTHELGLLRAVGTSRRQIRSAIRGESMIIALLGVVLGICIGLAFGAAVLTALSSGGFTQVTIPWGALVAVTILAATASTLAALFPARRAARLDVLDAIATT